MKKYRASRFRQLIFPQELIIDRYHVLTRKRNFPLFWIVSEESIPLSKLASIQIKRGLMFSRIIIENSGGPFPIIVDGIWNKQASEARDLLERIEQEIMSQPEIDKLVGEAGSPKGRGPDGGGGIDSQSDESNHQSHENDTRESSKAVSNEPLLDFTESNNRYEKRSQPKSKSALDVIAETKNRKFGEIPSGDWTPPAPWQPKVVKNESYDFSDETNEINEVNPVEFLMNESETKTAVYESEPVKKPSAVEQLSNWWQNAVSNLGEETQSGKKRKKRRLN